MKLFTILFLISYALSIKLISTYNHDDDCYTQGLFFFNQSSLLESCGLYGKSRIRHLNFNQLLTQYQKQSNVYLPSKVFGEGITLFNGKVYVLTWRQKKVYVYDQQLKDREELTWDRQGWGITHNNTHMFISDGSSTIYVVDEKLSILQHISVKHNEKILRNLNQLQFYKGNILANIYYQNTIAEIDPLTGIARLHDLKSIVDEEKKVNSKAEVLNGIAYDEQNQRLMVTGKLWKNMYEVQL